jgi:hypothetical protein
MSKKREIMDSKDLNIDEQAEEKKQEQKIFKILKIFDLH